MPNITIRNIPDDLHKRLKERAAANRRSLNNEILSMLEEKEYVLPLGAQRQHVAMVLEEIRRNRVEPRRPITDDDLVQAAHDGQR